MNTKLNEKFRFIFFFKFEKKKKEKVSNRKKNADMLSLNLLSSASVN